ncbi:MAG TPA: hypothetical protein V6D00_01160 [Pantanalinema sp.]
MVRAARMGVCALAIALAIGASGCLAPVGSRAGQTVSTEVPAIRGRTSFVAPVRALQSSLAEATGGAAVSLIDAATGLTVASALTDASGAFTLDFKGIAPVNGSRYLLEAVKGLSVGGLPDRPGAAAVRIRTLLFWNDGWQSLTNATPNSGISIGAATTALSVVVGLKQQAGIGLDPSLLVNKVSGSTFNPSGTGLSDAADFQPVLQLVSNALELDQDPLSAIAFDGATGTYRLAVGTPWISSLSPESPAPGQVLTLRGSNLDRLNGRSTFWFGNYAAATWSVSPDRATATMSVPAQAYCGPFSLQQPSGVAQVIRPMLLIKGTVGTFAGMPTQKGFADGPGRVALFDGVNDLVFDNAGNLYASELYNRRIRRITPSGEVSTLAGDGTQACVDGVGTSARLSGASAMAFDGVNSLYFTEYVDGARVRRLTLGGTLTTVAGTATPGYLDGPALSAQFNQSFGLCILGNGDLLIGDQSNNRIRRLSGGVVSTFAGGAAGSTDGATGSALFKGPCSVQPGVDGAVYVVDYMNHAIRRISASGTVTTFAGLAASPGFVDGLGSAARFSDPVGMKIDSAGNLYLADSGNHAIRKISPSGAVTTIAGTGVSGSRDGAVGIAQFYRPYGVAVDSRGNVYVADNLNHTIRVICP